MVPRRRKKSVKPKTASTRRKFSDCKKTKQFCCKEGFGETLKQEPWSVLAVSRTRGFRHSDIKLIFCVAKFLFANRGASTFSRKVFLIEPCFEL